MTDFLLPSEMFDHVPPHLRADVANVWFYAKYCAVVEAVMKQTGEPIEVDLERVKEIAAMNPRTTDPRDFVMIAERHPDGQPGPIIHVGLATVEEVQAVLTARSAESAETRGRR